MAGPTYSTDLTPVTNAETGETWTEITTYAGGGTGAFEQDYFIQGNGCYSAAASKTAIGSLMSPAHAGFTVPTDGAVLVWMKYDHPNALETFANGGIRTFIGNSNTVWKAWKQGGRDTYQYGGWLNLATNDTVANDYNGGTLASPYQRAGVAYSYIYGTAPKGAPMGCDAIRVGRCQLLTVNGDGTEAGGFANMAANNDAGNNRWGLFQAVAGGYLWKGLMSLGNTTNYVHFVDSNKSITVDNTIVVTSPFNKIEVSNNSSNVIWTNITITSLSTVSRGTFQVVDHSANVTLDTCTFTDMGTFDLRGNSRAIGTTFRRCLSVSANSSNLQSSTFASYQGASNTSALVWGDNTDTNGKLDGCSFVHGTIANNCHGLRLANTSLSSITLTGVSFSGYNTSNGQPNSAIHVMKSSGDLTINITGGTTPSILSEGAAVNVVSGSVDILVHVSNTTGANVQDAVVILKAADGTGPFPYQETVTIENTGTNANVHHIGHGMATNDRVLIDGASHWQNNGVFLITKISDDYYSYTLPSAPGSSPTGTIVATFVALFGNTDSTGTITTSRVYSSGQNVTGWVRKSSSAPYYITSSLTGQVNNASGYTGSAILIPDQ